MNNKILHKIISIWTVALLMLPMGMQFVHSIENHEHTVCDSKDIQHIHNLELDCSYSHVKLKNEASVLAINFTFTKPKITHSVPVFYISKKKEVSLYYKSTRGPPQFIV